MRWPNRHPHILTRGMRDAQRALAAFLPLVDWNGFQRRNMNEEVRLSGPSVASFACADARQAIVWLLRADSLTRNGMLDEERAATRLKVTVPGLVAGTYDLTWFDTRRGEVVAQAQAVASGAGVTFNAIVQRDIAIVRTGKDERPCDYSGPHDQG
jgi:hypothetical protein